MFRPPYEVGETLRQLYELGVRSVPLITVAGLAVGVVLSMHTRASLERFGAEAMIPAGLALALVKETGPLTAGLLLSGRIGAGIGAEIGAMKVTEQIDALEATAVDSFKYLVVTRMVACVVALPILTTIMNGCRDCRRLSRRSDARADVAAALFRPRLFLMDFADLVPATLKTAVFGFIIADRLVLSRDDHDPGNRRCGPRLDAQRRHVVGRADCGQCRTGAADLPAVSRDGVSPDA